MTTTCSTPVLDEATIAAYRRDGFVRIDNVLSKEECVRYRAEALRLAEAAKERLTGGDIFQQLVNVWRESPVMAELTLDRRIAGLARQLAGCPLRLWHDHLLIKEPHNGRATEFHQDQPYWPHANSEEPLSAWIALQDVPAERGCMSFIPGSQRHRDLAVQNFHDPDSLYGKCEDLRYEPRVTLPLRAGSLTFHHGRCAHRANPNQTDQHRVAHVVIYMPHGTTFTGTPHIINADDVAVGSELSGELFPDLA